MGKGSRKEGRQLTRFFSCSNPSETSLFRLLREHLLCVHSAVDGSASFFFPPISDFLDAISDALSHEMLGGCGERGGRLEREDLLKGTAAAFGSDWGFGGFWRNADCKHNFPSSCRGVK
jgi:hypothetical protein